MLYIWYIAIAILVPLLAFISWLCFCAWVTKKDAAQAASIIRASGSSYPSDIYCGDGPARIGRPRASPLAEVVVDCHRHMGDDGGDPITIVVAAVALGAQEGVRETVANAVKDAYAGLKRLITDRYKGVDPTAVENKANSDAKRASLEEDLKDAGAESDAELLAAAKAVIEAVLDNPQAGEPIGVNLEEIEAEAIRIHNVWSSGGGVRSSRCESLRARRHQQCDIGPEGVILHPLAGATAPGSFAVAPGVQLTGNTVAGDVNITVPNIGLRGCRPDRLPASGASGLRLAD